jgi:hypothetical protein
MIRRKRTLWVAAAAVAAGILLVAGMARAYINPGYTPVNLVELAEYIMVVKLSAPKDGKVTIKIVEVLKDDKKKAPKGPLTIDTTITAMKAHAKSFREKIKLVGDEPVMFFVGKGEKEEDVFLLHMKGRWYSMDSTDKPDLFDLHQRDDAMEGTWAGGTDMLLKVTRLLIKFPDTDVPVASGVKWDKHIKVGNIKGKVSDSRAVDLDGSGQRRIYLACDAGDRIYSYDKKTDKFVDETAKRKLTARSKAAVWADFNADGKLDLASWDGASLNLCLQLADGSFAAPAKAAGSPTGKCLGLTVLDSGRPGKPALLWSGEQGPSLLLPAKDGFTATKLPMSKIEVAKLGKPSRCLVGDIDGDSVADVLWPAVKGSVFFRGLGVGRLDAGAACNLLLGRAPGSAFFGDWDMDGRLDVFTIADDGCRLWHNRPGKKEGEFRFEQSIHISGEAAYISKPGGLWGNTCDVNNDGRQDLFWVYSDVSSTGPHIFFNRGFRSFGHAHTVDITEQQNIGGAEDKGQQHGVVADFTGDAAQDMAVVLKNGDFYVFPREVADQDPLCVRACLPVGGKIVGPVKVTAWSEQACLGAWNLTAGTDEAFFGQLEAGKITIKWQLPGSKEVKTMQITLDEKPRRIVLGASAGSSGTSSTPKTPATATTGKKPTRPATESESDAKLNLPLIGGCAAGVLLLIIILVVMRKKKAA